MSLKQSRKKWCVLLVVIIQIALLNGWYSDFFPKLLIYNYSASLPRGWYLIIPGEEYKIGDIVAFETPQNAEIAYQRQWMKREDLMLKKIGAFEGAMYSVSDYEFRIEGHFIGSVFSVDHEALPMPKLRGRFLVKEGYFLPVAELSDSSFDGRYFGDVPLTKIRYKVVPFLTE